MKTLVIDDHREIADNLVRMLSMLGFEAEAVYGSRAAIFWLNSKVPDVVFLDINMPGVTGFDVLGFIKREPKFQETIVFMISSEDHQDTIDRAYQRGVVTYIIKPVTLEVLEKELAKHGLL